MSLSRVSSSSVNRSSGPEARRRIETKATPPASSRSRGEPEHEIGTAGIGLEQHEFAVAIDHGAYHLGVAVARHQPLAHHQSKVAADAGVALVDALVAADRAAQPGADLAGARLERRVVEHLIGFDRECGRRDQREDEREPFHSAATVATGARRAPAATRIRRSVSETTPPSAIRIAPPQIHAAIGLIWLRTAQPPPSCGSPITR